MRKIKATKMLFLISGFSLLTACGHRGPVIPESRKTVIDIYESITPVQVRRPVQWVDESRSQQDGPALLPNPVIKMHVYGHLVGDAWVPDYTTQFYLYERNHIAQPGEVVSR